MNATWDGAAQAWWSWIGPLSVQCAVLAVAFALADRLLARRAPVRVRAAFGWAFLVRIALPPGLESPVAVVQLFGTAAAEPVAAAPAAGIGVAFAAWGVGAALLAAIVIRRAARDRDAWIGRSQAAHPALEAVAREAARRIGLARVPRILVGDDALGPAAVGILRPAVVIPSGLARVVGSRHLEHVLLHEMAHVARRDALAALLWSLARTCLWFHPAVHLWARHAATLREIACDERAAHAAGGAQAYRTTLVEIARPMASPGALGASAFFPPEPLILARLRALERLPRSTGARQDLAALATFALLAACCVPLARQRATASDPLADLDGCLRKRFAVMAALAAEMRTEPDRRTTFLPERP